MERRNKLIFAGSLGVLAASAAIYLGTDTRDIPEPMPSVTFEAPKTQTEKGIYPAERLSDDASLEVLNSQFNQTLSWMSIYPNDDVRDVAVKFSQFKTEYDLGDKTHLDVVSSGIPDQIASVGNYASEEKLKITLSLNEFLESDHSVTEIAWQLYREYQLYEAGSEDPQRYLTDEAYRIKLDLEAIKEANEAFSVQNRINPSKTI